ncbi:UNVERIFIED_CONTAM: hypothetical protein Scaly_2242900 [Sesamum calycinum]|uniref:RNase H type-1 domain-containing protein n=1 Tax=Sesamum calycinum TaxID=2727403 RepID=A0AAW2MCI7_9LAMI
MVTKRGIEANPEKIEASLQIPMPKSMKDIHKLTGRMTFLSRFISKAANKGAEKNYLLIEKYALALIVIARKLRPYFQSHAITMLTDQPLKQVLTKPDALGRLGKWLFWVDGSSNSIQGRAGIVPREFEGAEFKVAVKLNFVVTNDEAEYEAVIIGMEIALQLGAKDVIAYTDSQLVA